MKIVSGKTGTPHVTSQQFRQILEGTIGQDSYILTSGENLEPELSTNNLLKIKSGMMSHHGNVSSVELGTYDEVTIANGSQGMKRIDLIVNRYSRNEETGVEQNSWVVIQGTPAASSPAVPSHTVGNLQEGDLVDDCPVFEVHLDGINVTEVKKLLSVTENMSTLNADLAELSSVEVVTLKNGVRLTRCGKLRILQCVNASSPEAGNIVDVPAADVPDTYVMASAAYKGQQRGDYFLSLSPTSKKVGLYYGGDNPQVVPGNYIVGQLVWFI